MEQHFKSMALQQLTLEALAIDLFGVFFIQVSKKNQEMSKSMAKMGN